ncbi:MAG TPA: T9SS type A sorting domain-containing protein [Chitinophagaceae bacterium]|nr:T9SS type A sorting domain-containing protein [Chitinophagaceae bacterium]
MASQFGQRIVFILLLCFATKLHAQTVVSYPSQSSGLLKSTAEDVAGLFQSAIPGAKFISKPYTSVPVTGIILIYDASIAGDQSCKIESDGKSFIRFSSSQDNGLCYGIYTYFRSLGFRFYLPGTIWEKIPNLASPYQTINKIVSGTLKYNGWGISGGHNRWAMDMDNSFGWDTYYGKNGHEWSKYQRRNGMIGTYRFSGHRGDILNTEYLSTLQSNPCYVACFDGKRISNSQAVPDINNIKAKEYWASSIEKQYSWYKERIYSSPSFYANIFYGFNYVYKMIGIEVPDGARWGNSSDNLGCSTGNYDGKPYPKETDQHFMLANFTAEKINSILPGQQFQSYAYSSHADVPSFAINKNIDVQVIPSGFQVEASPKALMNRWYNRHSNISEYHYFNIPQWTGETPVFSLDGYKNDLLRVKEKHTQGMVLEASPAKFGTLPYLYAGNNFLINNIPVDSSLNDFVATMFPGKTGTYVRSLFKSWGDDNITTWGSFMADNKYKLPLFFQQLNKAIEASTNADEKVKERLQELKAYLHYIVLYDEFINDSRSYPEKSGKAAELCLYLAKINKLQLVNSFFLILDIVRKFPVTSEFYKQYNVYEGSAYLNGSLPLITDEEINKNFSNDLLQYNSVTDYKFDNAVDIINKMKTEGLKPMDKIHLKIGYTNGYNYSNRAEFYFYAPAAGTVNINCIPNFDMPGKGFLNLSVEADDKALLVVHDETITPDHNPGNITVKVPSPGVYKLSLVSQWKTGVDITITTNGTTFFKKGPYYGNRIESYKDDNWKYFPKYFYVPNISKLYFSINGSCYTGTCLTPSNVINAFGIKDSKGKEPLIEVSPKDSSLYSISVSAENAGRFWQVDKMREYVFCLANISNIEIYAEPKPQAGAMLALETEAIAYPNPSNGIFNFKKNNVALQLNRINIYNPQGEKVADVSNTSSIDLSRLPSGVYIFSAQKENDIIKGKLIKN